MSTTNAYRALLALLILLGPEPRSTPAQAPEGGSVDHSRAFEEGIISTGRDLSLSFDPDGSRVYFMRWDRPPLGTRFSCIWESVFSGGRWSVPHPVSFAGALTDANPFVSPDGDQLFFRSNRPRPGIDAIDHDLWVADRAGRDWSTPRNLGPVVNSPAYEGEPSVSRDGTLYFRSDRPGGRGRGDLYIARRDGNTYHAPEALGSVINSAHSEALPYISPHGDLLLFASDRPGGYGGSDLYLSRRVNGVFTEAINLGSGVNSTANETAPHLSPESRLLVFTRDNSGRQEIRYVEPKRVPPLAEALKPPVEARVFAPGVISTPEGREYGICFDPEERTAYFTRDGDIYISHRISGRWTQANPASFNSQVFDGDPFITRDGTTLYFMSERADPGADSSIAQSNNIWFIRKRADGRWGAPQKLPPPLNSDAMEGFQTLTDDGTMYYFSMRDSGLGGRDIYRSRPRGGGFLPPEHLGPPISTEHGDYHPFIAPDESFMIFSSSRPGGYGSCDLYLTRRDGDAWTQPHNLGPTVNTKFCDMTPYLSRDGTCLFFCRIFDDGNRDLFVIECKELLESIRRESTP